MIRLFIILLFAIPICVLAQYDNGPKFPTLPWRIYHLDRQFYNHNSISPGDANRDGNCEEYYDPERNTIIGVVWFENPTID